MNTTKAAERPPRAYAKRLNEKRRKVALVLPAHQMRYITMIAGTSNRSVSSIASELIERALPTEARQTA